MIEAALTAAAIQLVETGSAALFEQVVQRAFSKKQAATKMLVFATELAALRSQTLDHDLKRVQTDIYKVLLACMYVKLGLINDIYEAFEAAGGKIDPARKTLVSIQPDNISRTIEECLNVLALAVDTTRLRAAT